MKYIVALFFLIQMVSLPLKGQKMMSPDSTICFMDSKRMEYQEAGGKVYRDEATGIGEVISARKAILHFGEIARNGIWTFWTLDKKEEAPLQPDEYLIDGTVSPMYNGESAMLFTFEPADWDKIQHVDTVMVANGKFSFRGKVCDNNPSVLVVGNYPKPTRSIELLLDAGKIQVSLDSMSVAGTPLNDMASQFKKHIATSYTELSKIKSDSLQDSEHKSPEMK